MNEINIKEERVLYKLDTGYCSDMREVNCTAQITGIKNANGTVTLLPEGKRLNSEFVFDNSDPDKVIAVARLMMGMAQMVKDNNNRIKMAKDYGDNNDEDDRR